MTSPTQTDRPAAADQSAPELQADGVADVIRVMDRRKVLAITVTGAAAATLAACSSGSESTPSSAAPATSSAPAPASSMAAAASEAPVPTPTPTGKVIAKTADAPVGSGNIVKADGSTYVVAQPTAGTYVCHSGVCTHEGCKVSEIQGETVICRCHGSEFNLFTGSVEKGPAPTALASVPVEAAGGNIVAT